MNIVQPLSMPDTLDETKIYVFGFHVDWVPIAVIVLPHHDGNESHQDISPKPDDMMTIEEVFKEASVRI